MRDITAIRRGSLFSQFSMTMGNKENKDDMSKIELNETNSGYNLQKINNNFDKIEKEFNEKVLYRDNPEGEPNEMLDDLDMNGNRIYNLPTPREDHEAARLKDVRDAVVGNINANLIQFEPTEDISSTNVQGAIEEAFHYGDPALRQDLSNSIDPTKGASIIGRSIITLNSVDEMINLPIEARRSDQIFRVIGYHSGTSIGGGDFTYDPSRSGENDGGMVLDGFVRVHDGGSVTPELWGAQPAPYDSSDAIERALNSGYPVEFNEQYRVTRTIEMSGRVVASINRPIILDGDVDVWFFGTPGSIIEFSSFKAQQDTDFNDRQFLNRMIRTEYSVLTSVGFLETWGASTSLHALFGELCRVGEAWLHDMQGTDAQYGYGINTSSRHIDIGQINILNETVSGRHALYVNGGIWEEAKLGGMVARNIGWNPIQIINTDSSIEYDLTIGDLYFYGCSSLTTADTTGCINISGETAPTSKIVVGNVLATRCYGPSLTKSVDGANQTQIGDVTIIRPQLKAGSLSGLHIRYGVQHTVGDVVFRSSLSDYLAAVFLRDCSVTLGNVTVSSDTQLGSALRAQDCPEVLIDTITTPSGISKISTTASNVYSRSVFPVEFELVSGSTPSVKNRKNLFNQQSSGSVSITNFVDGEDGQEIVFLAQQGNTTLIHSNATNGIHLKGGTDLVLGTRGVVKLIRFGSRWVEV